MPQPEEELRMWIKNNLLIETESADKYGAGHSVYVALRLKDDHLPFTRELVYIPTGEND